MASLEDPVMASLKDPEMASLDSPVIASLEDPEIASLEDPEIASLEDPVIASLETPVMASLENPVIASLEALPPELQLAVVAYLSPRDLVAVALLARHFYRLTDDPKLWVGAKASRLRLEVEGLEGLLKQRRFILLRYLDLSYLDLTRENHETIAKLPFRLASLRLRYTQLLPIHTETLLQSCSDQGSKGLTCLDLDSVPLGQVSDDLLARALSPRLEVGLSNTQLSTFQVASVLVSLLNPLTRTESLSLAGLDLREVGEPLLRQAALHLRCLDLANSSLLPHQLYSLLQAVLWSTRLEEMDLTGADLAEVPAQLLADAAPCLSSLSLCGARLADKQLAALLQATSLPSSALDQLNLAALDLAELPANMMARCIPSLVRLNLSYCRLSTEQVTAVVRCLGRKDSHVTCLELARADLTTLPSGLFTRALAGLDSMSLAYCSLTVEQTAALVTACCRGLQAGVVKVDLRTIPTKLLCKASKQGLSLRYAQFTEEQKKALAG